MKKRILLLFSLVVCLMFIGNVNALTEGFDDEVFHSCLLETTNQEESLTAEQLSEIKVLDCDGILGSTKGIEKLTNLEELKIKVNDEFSGIDLSSNTKLKKLTIYGKGLKEISLTANTLLEELDLSTTSISSLDLQSNTALKKLVLSETSLETVNTEKNTELEILNITDSNIKVDLTKNTKLKELYINKDDLGKIDVAKLTSLTKLYVLRSLDSVLYVKDNEEKDLKEELKRIAYDGNSSLKVKYKSSEPVIDDKNATDVGEHKLKIGDYFGGYLFENGIKEYTLSLDGEIQKIKFDGEFVIATKFNFIMVNIKSDDYYIDEDNAIIYIGDDKVESVAGKIYINKTYNPDDNISNFIGIQIEVTDEFVYVYQQNTGQNLLIKRFTIKNGEPPILKCSEKDGKYFDKNGNSVSKEAYFESCGVVENPKTGLIIAWFIVPSLLLGISIMIISKRKTIIKKI